MLPMGETISLNKVMGSQNKFSMEEDTLDDEDEISDDDIVEEKGSGP